MNFDPSKCKGTWLHKYVILEERPEAVLERCVRCGKRDITRVYGGKIDNQRYLSTHVRQVLMKEHRLFRKEYPVS